MTAERSFDVIVVGGGDATLCPALAARERGASVLVLETPAGRGPLSPPGRGPAARD